MALDLVAILKLAPMAVAAYKQYRAGNLARNLDKLIQAQFERDPHLGPRARESLLEQWHYLHNDPRAAVVIAGLLAERDLIYLQAFEIRAREILDGLELLELGLNETVDRLVAAVANNFVAAQRDEQRSTQAAASAMLSAVEPLARRDQVER